MKKSCQNHHYSEKQFREYLLWTTDLERLASKFKIEHFLGAHPADHPYTNEHDSNFNTSTWIWNANTPLKSRSHWIVVFHKRCGNRYVYQIMDSLALLLSSYKDIFECISSMQHKDTNIETCLKNSMQSTNMFTCGWWSLYYLITSKFKFHSAISSLA